MSLLEFILATLLTNLGVFILAGVVGYLIGREEAKKVEQCESKNCKCAEKKDKSNSGNLPTFESKKPL